MKPKVSDNLPAAHYASVEVAPRGPAVLAISGALVSAGVGAATETAMQAMC